MNIEHLECFETAIAAYLKKNLRINLTMTENLDYYSKGVRIEVELTLGDEVIDTSSDYIVTSSSY